MEAGHLSAGYAPESLLKKLGAEFKVREAANITVLDRQEYRAGGLEETYLNRKPDLIRSALDLIARVDHLPAGSWLYRGHSVPLGLCSAALTVLPVRRYAER